MTRVLEEKMGIRKDPPPFDSERKPFPRYRTEVKTWTLVTEVPEDKWALVLALSLPEDDKSGIRNKVFDCLGEERLKGKEGYQEFVYMTCSTSSRSLRAVGKSHPRVCSNTYLHSS